MNQGGKSEMEETTFMADPMRLMIAALVGIIVLLVLNSTCADTSQYIIKLHANSGKYDTSCYCQWRCDQMDASGFRTWKYYWSDS